MNATLVGRLGGPCSTFHRRLQNVSGKPFDENAIEDARNSIREKIDGQCYETEGDREGNQQADYCPMQEMR